MKNYSNLGVFLKVKEDLFTSLKTFIELTFKEIEIELFIAVLLED